MKKVLLVVDGPYFPESAFGFACRLNEISPLLLTGVFLPGADYSPFWSYASAASSIPGAVLALPLQDGEEEAAEEAIRQFELGCRIQGIPFRVHKDLSEFMLHRLRTETRFADLAVLSGNLLTRGSGSDPSSFVTDILRTTECPLLIVPEQASLPTANILAYDGSEDSVHAIKQFAYLFPGLATHPTLLVYVHPDANREVPEKEAVTELACRHFPDLEICRLELDAKIYFATWISEQGGALLVSGSYGRSTFSYLLRESFLDEVLAGNSLPVFIAHRK